MVGRSRTSAGVSDQLAEPVGNAGDRVRVGPCSRSRRKHLSTAAGLGDRELADPDLSYGAEARSTR